MSDNENPYEEEAKLEDAEEQHFMDSSEEDEDQDDFEQDDFIVADDGADDDEDTKRKPSRLKVESGDVDANPPTSRKKKRKKKRSYREDSPELAEGDLQLLEETGAKIDRRTKLKRLKKGASDEEDNDRFDDLRDLDDEEDQYEQRRRDADDAIDYDDEMGDFIDDGGRGRRRRAAEREGLVSSEAVRQARSIFGDIDDVTQYRGVSKLFQKGDGDDENDEDYTLEEDDDDEKRLRTIQVGSDDEDDLGRATNIGDRSNAEQGARIAKQLGTLPDNADEVERIVKDDVPEWLQEHFGLSYVQPSNTVIKDEAEWIFHQAFELDFAIPPIKPEDRSEAISRITAVLQYIHIDKFDIPYIAMYQKDYIFPFLLPPAGEVLREYPFHKSNEVPEDNRKPPLELPKTKTMSVPRGFNSYEYDDYRPGLSFEHLRGVHRGYDDGFGDWSMLWRILDLDKRYQTIQKRKRGLLRAATAAESRGVLAHVIEELKDAISSAKSEQRLKDVERYLQLAIDFAESMNGENRNGPSASRTISEKTSKRPSRRKNKYSEFCRRGYRDLTGQFGLSAREFAQNLRDACDYGVGNQTHVPSEADDEPLSVATLLASRLGEITTESRDLANKIGDRVLASARFILVTEIVAELGVVQTARDVLCKPRSVTINTNATPQGIAQVDGTHPLRYVSNLGDKTLESLLNTTDFALITRAQELGFTQLEITFQPEQVSHFERLLQSSILLQTDITSMVIEKWNEQRLAVVDAVKNQFMDQMRREILQRLRENTADVLRKKLTQAASRRLLLGPGRPHSTDDGASRVLAFCVTTEDDEDPDPEQVAKDVEEAKAANQVSVERRIARDRLTVVDLNENGEYKDGYEMFAAWLRRPSNRNNPASKLPDAVRKQLQTFIARSKAELIVIGIGSGGRSAYNLRRDLITVIKAMVCEKLDDNDERELPAMLSDREIDEIRREASRNDPTEDSRGIPDRCETILSKYIIFCDEYPARVYAKTNMANIGLSVDGMTLLEKRTIGLGRLAQEPLWVYAAIGHEDEVAMQFQIHPYHYYAKQADRLVALQRALIRSVCSVGVDINRVLRLPHTQPLMSYVGGLGANKGKALIKALEQRLGEEDPGLRSRKDLLSEQLLGEKVYSSCAGFFRVRDPYLHSGGSTRRAKQERRSILSRRSRGRRGHDEPLNIFNPMDDSRIHPKHYDTAKRIAKEALCDDEGNSRVDVSDSTEGNILIRTVSAVIEDPSGLGKLALSAYAQRLQDLGRGILHEIVNLIAVEFENPFKDHRIPLSTPADEAVFYLVTGADPIMFRVGSSVTGTNCQTRERRRKYTDSEDNKILGISCSLPHGIRGWIPRQLFSDNSQLKDEDILQLVPDGSSLASRIFKFEFRKFDVVLSSKISHMENPSSISSGDEYRSSHGYISIANENDPAYREYPNEKQMGGNMGKQMNGVTGEELRKSMADKRRRSTMSSLKMKAKPVVQHPLFRDIPGDEAIDALRSMLPGDIIIRPSMYDKNGIIFSCKFANTGAIEKGSSYRGVFHKDCEMQSTPENNDIPIRLKVDGMIYEDVDQVLEQYLRPIISNLSECLDHRKFHEGSNKVLEKYIDDFKRKNPKTIPYCIGLSEERPTNLVIVYIPGTSTVRKEQIQVVPDGYRYRGILQKNLEELFKWFKVNMRKGTNVTRAPAKEVTAASPFQSPFVSAASPFRPSASPYHTTRSPFDAPTQPVPARDAPPPPAPVVTADLTDPYRYDAPPRSVHDRPPPPAPSNSGNWISAPRYHDNPAPSMPPSRYTSSPRRTRDGGSQERGRDREWEREKPWNRDRDRGPKWERDRDRMPDKARSRDYSNRRPSPSSRDHPPQTNDMPVWRGQKPEPAWKTAEKTG